jgi:hypothetical protein
MRKKNECEASSRGKAPFTIEQMYKMRLFLKLGLLGIYRRQRVQSQLKGLANYTNLTI